MLGNAVSAIDGCILASLSRMKQVASLGWKGRSLSGISFAGAWRIIISGLFSFSVLAASEVADAKLAKIISNLKAEEQKISEIKQQANLKADATYAQARAKMVAAATATLKKSLESSDDPTFKVTVYKLLLNIDQNQEEALKFFKAVGNLDEVLSEAAKKPLLPAYKPLVPLSNQEADKTKKRETISIVANDLDRVQKFFKLKEPYLINGQCLILYDSGSLTLQDTPSGSFTIRFTRGVLGGKLDNNPAAPFQLPRFLIRGAVILESEHNQMCKAVGEDLLAELLVSFNAETNAYAVFSDSGIMIKEGKLIPKKGAPLFEAADVGRDDWGSRISNITLTQTPHPAVLKKAAAKD